MWRAHTASRALIRSSSNGGCFRPRPAALAAPSSLVSCCHRLRTRLTPAASISSSATLLSPANGTDTNANNIIQPVIADDGQQQAGRDDAGSYAYVSIDRSGLLGMKNSDCDASVDLSHKSPMTPMVQELQSQIKVRGPLSVADYMFQCLQHEQHGYYTSRSAKSIIGGKGDQSSSHANTKVSNDSKAENELVEGDFITSPELGQIFGEMVGLWLVQMWEHLGSPSKLRLLELGPGRGTLMKDVLRTAARFPAFLSALELHLLETSPSMREEQIQTLGVENVNKSIPISNSSSSSNNKTDRMRTLPTLSGVDSTASPTHSQPSSSRPSTTSSSPASANSDAASLYSEAKSNAELLVESVLRTATGANATATDIVMSGEVPMRAAKTSANVHIPIHWHASLSALSHSLSGKSNQHQPSSPSSSSSSSSSSSTSSSAASAPLLVIGHEFLDALPVYQFQMTERGWCEKLVDTDRGKGPHHFRFVLSAQPTLASRTFLPPDRFPTEETRLGEAIEVGAAGLAVMEQLCYLLSKHGGSALFIDYGTDHPNPNTLQAVSKHQYKHVLEEPGKVDLTTLVDFKSLRATVERTNARLPAPLAVLPLVTQSHFLRNLNIAARLEQLVMDAQKSGSLNEQQLETLISNAVRLVDPDPANQGMGSHFKVLCVVDAKLAKKKDQIVPFQIKDEWMEADRMEREKKRKEVEEAMKNGEPSISPAAEQLPFVETPRSAVAGDASNDGASSTLREHLLSAAPPSDSSTAQSSKSASTRDRSSSTVSSVYGASASSRRAEERRRAAREAANALARARAAAEQGQEKRKK